MLFLRLVLLQSLLIYATKSAEQIETSRENAEYYHMENGKKYGVMLEKVSHLEAKVLCAAKGGQLLELRSVEVAEFVALALAESAVGSTAAWIGGEYNPYSPGSMYGIWVWSSGDTILSKPVSKGTQFPMKDLPFWAYRPNMELHEPLCLTMARNLHHEPVVAGMDCRNRRPYICSLRPSNDTKPPEESLPPLKAANKTFHLYKAEYTWFQALTFCGAQGYQLATVTKLEDFAKLQSRMKRARPVMENAWLGGALLEGMWQWATTSQPINMTNHRGQIPWHYTDKGANVEVCLLADHHVCEYFAYVEARCTRRRSFVCEQGAKLEDAVVMRKVSGTNLFISTVKLTWEDAVRKCAECLTDGILLELNQNDRKELPQVLETVFTAMTSTLTSEIGHIWLGGYLQRTKKEYSFRWAYTRAADGRPVVLKEELYSNTSSAAMLKTTGEDGFLSYCPEDFQKYPELENHRCLNLDRESVKRYFMYGLSCSFKQHFICKGVNSNEFIPHSCANETKHIKKLLDGLSPSEVEDLREVYKYA